MIPSAAWAATMMINDAQNGSAGIRIEIAIAPKTLLMPSQPMVLNQFRRPGTTIDLPNGSRAAGIWARPSFGPIVLSRATKYEPMRLPTTIAASEVTKPSFRKSAVTSVPMKNAAGTRFGVNQTVNVRPTEPYRALSGIGSMPWASIERSPSWVGIPPRGIASAVMTKPFLLYLVNVTGCVRPAWWTTLVAGTDSATTRPARTTHRAAGRRRIASASSAQSKTTKLAGSPSFTPQGTPAARAGLTVTMSNARNSSARPVIWPTWTSIDSASSIEPRPSGYHGSMIESCPQATLMPAASSSLTRVMPRRFG